MTRQTGTGSRRIRLYRVAFIQQAFIIKLLQKPPKCFYVFIVISNIGIIHIDKVSHLFRKFTPLFSEHHHVLTTSSIIFFRRDVFLRSLIVDIFLSNTKFLFHTKFYRQSMCIPARFSMNLIATHRFITIKRILDGTCQHMMNTGMTICRRRTFKENKLRTSFTFIYRFMEHIILFPCCQYILVGLTQIQTFVLGKFLSHILLYFYITYLIKIMGAKLRKKYINPKMKERKVKCEATF